MIDDVRTNGDPHHKVPIEVLWYASMA